MDTAGDFLQETEFCDFSNQKIKDLAEKIADGAKDDRELAVKFFYWVRDNILYSVGNWQRKASQTLEEGIGTCTNKSNLLVALLRYKKISAGYGVMKVYGQQYFGPIAIPMIRKFIGKVSTHTYTVVSINGKWIKCDPSDDKQFCENTSYFNHTTKITDWDGFKDSPLNLEIKDIIEDKSPIDNIDPWMRKKSKNAKGIPLKIANIYIDFARNNTKKVSGPEEMEVLFKKYLKEKYPIYFYLFKMVSLYKNKKSD